MFAVLRFTQGTSDKVYIIQTELGGVTVFWGKWRTYSLHGRSKLRSKFYRAHDSEAYAARVVRDKLSKGYVDVTSTLSTQIEPAKVRVTKHTRKVRVPLSGRWAKMRLDSEGYILNLPEKREKKKRALKPVVAASVELQRLGGNFTPQVVAEQYRVRTNPLNVHPTEADVSDQRGPRYYGIVDASSRELLGVVCYNAGLAAIVSYAFDVSNAALFNGVISAFEAVALAEGKITLRVNTSYADSATASKLRQLGFVADRRNSSIYLRVLRATASQTGTPFRALERD